MRLKLSLVCLLLAGCSDAQCRKMDGAWAALFCGGQGVDAPGPIEPPAAACADLSKQAPALFALLDDPSKPLDALRASLHDLNAQQYFDPSRPACSSDAECGDVSCEGAVCA